MHVVSFIHFNGRHQCQCLCVWILFPLKCIENLMGEEVVIIDTCVYQTGTVIYICIKH